MAHSVLDQFRGHRPLLIFCKDSNADTYLWQKNELEQYVSELAARNVKVVYLFTHDDEQVASDPGFTRQDVEALVKQFQINKGQFTALFLDKDGREKLRDERPVAAQPLLSIIDVMPSRKEELGQ